MFSLKTFQALRAAVVRIWADARGLRCFQVGELQSLPFKMWRIQNESGERAL